MNKMANVNKERAIALKKLSEDSDTQSDDSVGLLEKEPKLRNR